MSNTDDWQSIIARVKDWVVSERLSEEDRPTPLAAIDAIRWCNAHTDEKSPGTAIPLGGCIVFEWYGEQGIEECLEFDGSDEAIRTVYEDGKVIAKSRVPIVAAGEGE